MTGIWSCWSDCAENVINRYCIKPEFWLEKPEQTSLGVIHSQPDWKYVSTRCPGLEINSQSQLISGQQFALCPQKPFVPDPGLPPLDSIEVSFFTASTGVTTTSGSPLLPADSPHLGQVSDQGSDVNNRSMRAATQTNINFQTSNDSGLLNFIFGTSKLYLAAMLFLSAALIASLIIISVLCCCFCCGKPCGTSSLRKNRSNRSREAAAHTSTSTTSSSPSTPTSRTSGDQVIPLMPLEPLAYNKTQSISPQSLSPQSIGIGSPMTLQNAFGVSFTIQPAAASQLQQPPIFLRQVSTTSQGDRARTSKPPSSPASPVTLDTDSTLEHQPRSNDFNMAILSSFEHSGSGRPNGAAAAIVSPLTSAAMVVPQPESPSHNYYNFSSPAQLNKLNSQPAGASSNIPEQPPPLQSLKLPSVRTRTRLGTQSTLRSSTTSDDLQSLSEIGSQHSKMSPCGPIYPLQSNASKMLNRFSPQISIDAESDRGAATTSNLATRRHAQNSGQRLPRLLLASQQPSLHESPQNEEVPVALPVQSQQSTPRSPIPRSPPAAFAPGVADPTIQQLISSANGTLNGTWTTNTATLFSDDSMRSPLLPATPTVANASTPLYAGLLQLGSSGCAANETDVAITAQLLASPTQSEAPQVNGGLSRLSSFSGGPQGAAAAAGGGVAAAVAVPGGRHVYEKSVSCTPSHESAVQPQQFTFNPVEQRPRRLTGVTAPPVVQRPGKRSTRGPSVSSTRAGLDPPDSALPASIILTPNGVDDVHEFP